MEQPKTLDRREFTLATALAMLSGVAITISSACSSNSGYSTPTNPTPTPTPTPAPTGDKEGVISNNHGHRAVVSAAQFSAGVAITLHIQYMATHDHTVDLSAADLTAIAANTQVAKQSSTNSGHNHTVTFN